MGNKYTSRKFIVTLTTVVLTAVLAYLNVMTNPVAMVFAAAIGSYNLANAAVHKAAVRD